jgi:hypothetical protein
MIRSVIATSFGAAIAVAAQAGEEVQPSEEAVTRPILGLVALLVLAYIAGRPGLAKLEKRLALNPLVTTGLVFVLLGSLAASGNVKILTESVIKAIAPIVPLGLGWIGFRIGFNYDRRLLANPPAGLTVLAAALLPVLFMMAGAAAAIAIINPSILTESTTLRDVLLIGIAGAMTSMASVSLIIKDPKKAGRLEDFVKFEHIVGTILLMLVAVYFRPQGQVVTWQLPPMGWLFVTVGVGGIMGAFAYGLFRNAPAGPPFIVLLLGLIAMTAGMASFLRLGVIPVCALSGALVGELPGDWKDQVRKVLIHMERPVFFILLVVAGALWNPSEWQGWALMAILVLARLGGKRLATWIIARRTPDVLGADARRALTLAPIGSFAIAIVITARDLYPTAKVPWMLTAGIGGAIVSEVILQIANRTRPAVQP